MATDTRPSPLNHPLPLAKLVRPWLSLPVLAPALVWTVVVKLALSDGGRDLQSLILAQAVIFSLLAAIVWTARFRGSAVTRALLGIVAAVALASVWSVRPEASVRELLLWLMYLGIAGITASAVAGVDAGNRFLASLVAIAAWLCLIALFMFWGAGNPDMRWYSTFYWPNPFAAFLLLVLPLSLVRFLHAPRGTGALAHGSVALLLLVSLVFTYSRAAWMALGVVVFLAGIPLRSMRWRMALGRLAVLGVVVAVVVLVLARGVAPQGSGQQIVTRARSVSDPGDYAFQGRLNFWRAGLQIFIDHPLVGTGAGTFGAVHAAYQRDVRYYARDPHSLYVQTAAEEGIVGLVVLVVLLGALAAMWIKALRAWHATEAYPLVVGTGLGLVAFFIHSGVDMDWMFPANPAMAMAMTGALVSFANARNPSQAEGRSTLPRWQRLAVSGAVLVAFAFILATGYAEREFASGQELARTDGPSEAIKRYTVAVRWDPWNPKFLAARAAALRQLYPPQRDAAEESLRRAMAVDRMNASHPIQLALLLLDRPSAGPSQVVEAEGLLTQALILDPLNRPEAYRMLARIYIRQGRSGDAVRLYQQVVPRYLGKGLGGPTVIYAFLWPEVTGLVLDAADFAAPGGDLAQAVLWLRDVLDEDSGAVAVALRLSKLYLGMRRVTDARAVLETTAARVPNDPDILKALRALP
jgi:O-antigen ligase